MTANHIRAYLLAAILLATVSAQAGSLEDLETVPEQDLQKIEAALPKAASVQTREPRKLLVVWLCHRFYHDSIPWGNKALEMMGASTGAYQAVLTRDASIFRPEYLQQFDAVFLNNTYSLEKEMDASHRQALLDYVAGGGGLAGLHGAGDNFGAWPEGSKMIGGKMQGHPWFADSTVRVTIEDPGHPINRGFQGQDFFVKDEIYQFVNNYSRANQQILLALDMYDPVTATGGRHPRRADRDYAVSWIKKHGQGRVFYCSLGHNKAIYWNPAILQHYLDGIQFALGDLTDVDTTPSAQLYNAADIQEALPKLINATDDAKALAAEREIGLLLSRVAADMDRAVLPLVKAAGTSSGAKREALLRLCARSNHRAGLRLLRTSLDSEKPQLRQATIVALGQSAVFEGAELLVCAMERAKTDAEHHLALTTLVAIPTLRTERRLLELLDKALAAARTEDDVRTLFALYALTENATALKKVVTFLDVPKYRDAAIDTTLQLCASHPLKKFSPDAAIAACEKVIAIANDEDSKTKARQRINGVVEMQKRVARER